MAQDSIAASIAAPPTGWRLSPSMGTLALSLAGAVAYASALEHLGFSASALATVAAVGLAALLSGIAGFAFSAICGAMLFQFRHDTVPVVETMLICSIANQAFSVWTLRREIEARALMPFLAGGLIGVPTGVWLLLHLNAGTYKAALGAVLVGYGAYMLFRRPMPLRRAPRIGDVLSGFAGGLTGGFAATPGAPVSIWCGLKGADKVRQRAIFQPFILLMQFVALGAIALMHPHGLPNPGIPALAWLCVPAGLLGTWWGLACFRTMTDRQFGLAVNVLLIASGVGLAL